MWAEEALFLVSGTVTGDAGEIPRRIQTTFWTRRKSQNHKIKGRHFSSDPEVIAAAETWLDGQLFEFILIGLQKLEFGRCSFFPSWSG